MELKTTTGLFEPKDKKRSKEKIIIVASVVFLGVVGLLIGWYALGDHSVFSHLTTKNYKGPDNVSASFEYPEAMKYSSYLVGQLSKSSNTPLAYIYAVDSQKTAIVALTYLDIKQELAFLNLNPSQFKNQIKNDTGDYITQLNAKSPGLYNELYGSCNNDVTNADGQTNLICTSTSQGITTTKVIGVTQDDQYTLNLVMPNNIWSSHLGVWQKVEKSLTY